MSSTNIKSVARRIAKLEALSGPQPEHWRGRRWGSRAQFHPSIHVRFGNLRRLSEDYQGERHIEITRSLPAINGQEWVEFVEVPGPQPSRQPPNPGFPRCINVVFIDPYPERS
jgi:hypothetical protein